MIHLLFGDTGKIQPTAILDLRKEALDVKVYPNPTHHSIFFELNDDGTNYEATLFDLSGRMRVHSALSSNTLSMDGFEAGMYFAQIRHLPSGRTITKKVIKQWFGQL